jgi:Glycosyltransferase family 87
MTSDVDADPVSTKRVWVVGIVLAVVAAALVARSSGLGQDYLALPCVFTVCDDAGASIQALSEGDLHDFFAHQPSMGSVSLLLRTPAAIVANQAGGSDLSVYRAGLFVCVLAAGLLAVFLAVSMMRAGRPWTVWALLAAAVVVNPLTKQVAYWGHPEELLGVVFVVAAAIAAGRRHWLAAGLLFGAALATKQWAALAAIPILIAAPAGTRVRLTLTAGALAAVLTVPMLVGDPDRFHAAQALVSTKISYTHTVTASNLWWPLAEASHGPGLDSFGRETEVVQYSFPNSIGRTLHLGVAAVALVLSLLYWRRVRSRDDFEPDDVLQLIALLFLLRCMLDPTSISYHHTPFLIALISFEALRRRVPVMSAVAIGALLLMNEVVVPAREPALVYAFYVAWTVPLATAMALSLFGNTAVRSLGVLGGDRGGRGTPAPSLLHRR